jgi:hypothetical protein
VTLNSLTGGLEMANGTPEGSRDLHEFDADYHSVRVVADSYIGRRRAWVQLGQNRSARTRSGLRGAQQNRFCDQRSIVPDGTRIGEVTRSADANANHAVPPQAVFPTVQLRQAIIRTAELGQL